MSNTFIERFLKIFYVQKCAACRELLPFTTLDDNNCLCTECQEEWIREKTELCRICGKMQYNCKCGFGKSAVDSVRHLALYSSDDKGSVCYKVIHSLKKSNIKRIFDFASNEMIKHLIVNYDPATTVIVNVPRNPSTVRTVGYDHGLLLAKSISQKTGISYVQALLQIKGARVQKNLKKVEREQNARMFIRFKDGTEELIAGKIVLLIDDVGTTGATTGVCAELLKAHGATRVHCILFAKSSQKRNNQSLANQESV